MQCNGMFGIEVIDMPNCFCRAVFDVSMGLVLGCVRAVCNVRLCELQCIALY